MSKKFRSIMRKQTDTTTPKDYGKDDEEASTKKIFHSTSHSSPCPDDHLRCIDGLCITLDQICDKVCSSITVLHIFYLQKCGKLMLFTTCS